MKTHARIYLAGLMVTVPALVTFAAIGWLDGLIRELIPLPPGIALLVFLAAIYPVGLLTKLWLFRRIVRLGEKLIDRIPLVKTLYGAVRDLLKFLGGDEKRPKGEAVRLEVGPAGHMLGVTTGAAAEGDRVGVYLPMSYQIGGFLLYVPREKLVPAGMDVEAALKLILTGGMAVPGPATTGAPPAGR